MVFDEQRVLQHVARQDRLPAIQRRLRSSVGVAAMLADAASLTRTECGFTRALVLTITGDELSAAGTHALSDAASDRLRRQVQATPIRLVTGSAEQRMIHGSTKPWRGKEPHSVLADTLGLRHYALGVIAPETTALALLVVDRPDGSLDLLDRAMVVSVAAMIGITLEHLILHARMTEVSLELRSMTSSAQALMTEVLHAPLTFPTERRNNTAFPRPAAGGAVARAGIRELLSAREIEVAGLLVQGRSNREIAAELIISTATVKDCIVRLRRKLQATNRVDAAARYLQLTQADR